MELQERPLRSRGFAFRHAIDHTGGNSGYPLYLKATNGEVEFRLLIDFHKMGPVEWTRNNVQIVERDGSINAINDRVHIVRYEGGIRGELHVMLNLVFVPICERAIAARNVVLDRPFTLSASGEGQREGDKYGGFHGAKIANLVP